MKRKALRGIGVGIGFLAFTVGSGIWLGCKTQVEIQQRENRPINAQMENLGTELQIIRKDTFPWHNVTFLLNKRYQYEMELCDQPEIIIPYDEFKTPDGDVYDPSNEKLFRVHIYADEGRWPHYAAHN